MPLRQRLCCSQQGLPPEVCVDFGATKFVGYLWARDRLLGVSCAFDIDQRSAKIRSTKVARKNDAHRCIQHSLHGLSGTGSGMRLGVVTLTSDRCSKGVSGRFFAGNADDVSLPNDSLRATQMDGEGSDEGEAEGAATKGCITPFTSPSSLSLAHLTWPPRRGFTHGETPSSRRTMPWGHIDPGRPAAEEDRA
jgi:hypothetical protein